jgi:hypothetical protein
MLMCSQANQALVLESLKAGKLDMADVSESHIVDEIIRVMHRTGISQGMAQSMPDVRERRAIPFEMTMLLGIAAKMKVHMSLTDIPYAIQDTQALAELGYCLWESERETGRGLMDEGSIRHLVGLAEAPQWFDGYNQYVREFLLPKMDWHAHIHILDCTKVEVDFDNQHYEGAGVCSDGEGQHKGYKLATLRGIYGDAGMVEEVRFGAIQTHDLKLSEEMVLNSPLLREGDILLADRGFLSRAVINALKKRGINLYIPLRRNMEAYETAVSAAKLENKWTNHPNPKREHQRIAFVDNLGPHWANEKKEEGVEEAPLNGCVVWDTKKDEYYVFVTTDMAAKARQIIKTYELRPEIEEDFRQLKDFWQLERFRSKKLTLIAFHLVCTLLGYLFFQIYTQLDEGRRMAGKSLPIAMKKYQQKKPRSVILCVGQYYWVFPLLEFIQLYATLGADVRVRLDVVLASV